MIPTDFKESNILLRPPEGLTETQCCSVRAYMGAVKSGSCDGTSISVVAWQPNELDLARLLGGAPIFFTVMGGMPPHFPSTNFHDATHPA